MFREVEDKIPQKLCARGQARRREVRQMLLTSLQITRTHCTTLTEFHLFWTCLFQDLTSAGESDVVEYLRKTYFFHLPVEVARTQYGLTSPIHCAEGILCAAWWGAYCRVQPGSASGTQSLEVCHQHSFRDALVDEAGNQLSHLPPGQFFSHMQEVLQVQGRQLRKRSDPLPDYPRSRDALTVSSDRLAFIGRSTAVELHDKKHLIHKVPLDDSVAFVLPRTLLEWRQAPSKKDSASASDDEAGSWEQIPEKSITLSKAKARLIVQMAVELDCTKLQSLWTKAKVWQTGVATWLQHRERFVVVLTGPIADRYWMVGQKDLYLCACKYFAVSGRCEHEQCIHYMLDTGNIDLRVVGCKGGRPPKPVSSNRGWSSAALRWTSEREQECELQRREAKRQATAFAPQPPANISRLMLYPMPLPKGAGKQRQRQLQ